MQDDYAFLDLMSGQPLIGLLKPQGLFFCMHVCRVPRGSDVTDTRAVICTDELIMWMLTDRGDLNPVIFGDFA